MKSEEFQIANRCALHIDRQFLDSPSRALEERGPGRGTFRALRKVLLPGQITS
jgi:hypothetical protein